MIEKIPNYIFNISPGLELKDASFTDEELSPEQSIFSNGQMAIIQRMIDTQIAKIENEYHEKIENETKNAWQHGNETGIEDTKTEMMEQVNQLTTQLQKTISEIAIQTETIIEQHEQEILRLILAIARKVIEIEVAMNPDIILTTLRRSLEYLSEKEEIKIVVNPHDWSIVRENLQKLALTVELPQNIEVIANEAIESGGCRIDFKAGSIDADIETQFAEIKRKLMKQ